MSEDDFGRDQRHHGEPNPVINAVSNVVAAIRADDDQIALAKAHEALHPKAIEKLHFAEARIQPTAADAVKALLQEQGRPTDPEQLVPGVTARDTTIDGAVGSLPARIFTPTGAGPFPVIVYFHGGGWVIADKNVYDAGARGLAAQAGAVVVSVDYRQAPEHKFPAAWDDALAAYRWALTNAASIDGDPARVALAGESAGGNLAVATAIAARDAGLQTPAHVLSVYPVAQTSLNTESYIENAIAKPLNRAMVKWFVDHLVHSADDLKDTRLQLIDANLKGLPPVTIINARLDPLRSDGAKLLDALEDAGVEVERREYEGVAHEFFGAAAVLDKARQAQTYAGERLRESFGT
ncbi:alpha/beta hydrolase [Xylophilus sp. GOD-11R]|uniref:alpha/beta hydrolase n=1 Tax=Xylophilus sp. GOD-11R TaxID=3089814 RepID=UPI00298CBC7A|nr:alpha/beta hydrolase [Xylophilus sp. GOD-11R]WPB55319.1 alpha/beta hydrolase [Xylophilus sp. GOD-11R]